MRQHFNRPATGHMSFESAFNGIFGYLQVNNYLQKSNDPNKLAKECRTIMRQYLSKRNIKHKTNNSYHSSDFNANLIQNNFQDFVLYLKQSKNEIKSS